MKNEPVIRNTASGQESEDEAFEELSESSYTSDFEDDDPVSCVCDLPEEEAAAFRELRQRAREMAEDDGLFE